MGIFVILSYAFSILILIQIQRCFAIASDVPEFPLPERFKLRESVYVEFSVFLIKYNPLELGFGAPNYPPPENIKRTLANAAASKNYTHSQYSAFTGHPRLLKAISKFYSKFINRTLDPDHNVLVTVGATEALFVTFLSHTFSGDEWIIFEPFYDFYLPMIKAANGVPRGIKLKQKVYKTHNLTSADWTFDKDELSSLFNERTKGILVNTPHNSLGKVFTLDELTFIANLARKWKTLVVSDEVYRFLTFDDNEHISIATLPGMYEQTITIGSASKLFGATGYRVGWAYGDTKLIDNLKRVHSMTVLAAPTPTQEAIAVGFEDEMRDFGKPHSFIERLKRQTQANRDYLYWILKDAGMTPVLPEGGYFMVANWTTMGNRVVLDAEDNDCDDYKFAKWLIKNVKVLGLPQSSLFTDLSECSGKDFIRFTIIKARETYETAEKLFSEWQS